MDWQSVDRIGEQLRHLGHRRSDLVEHIQGVLQQGRQAEAEHLAEELAAVSMQTMELLSRQHGLFAAEFADRGRQARHLPTGPDPADARA